MIQISRGGNGLECISVDDAIIRGAQKNTILISVAQSEEIVEQLKQYNFERFYCVSEWLRKCRYFNPVVTERTDYQRAVPFNHYESPYPYLVEIHEKEKAIFDTEKEILDVDFNVKNQIELINIMKEIELPEWPENKSDNVQYRYYYNNSWFCKGSADALYYMIRIAGPKMIIEVGSGFSTAVMLDTNEHYFNNMIQLISIEPRPQRLKNLLKSTDNISIYERNLQDIPVDFFSSLEENDILFIDSSHVSKLNSDVNYIFFEILPRLKKGVYIHFHDIFYPFIYRKKWIYEGRAYNEIYLLRAFLMNNKAYSIQLFGEMLLAKYREKIDEKLQGCGSGSLWIKKIE